MALFCLIIIGVASFYTQTLSGIFLTDENGFTISSGTENWYYDIKGVPEFVNVLDGKTAFYNDEHISEGYRQNAVKCGNGILVVRRPYFINAINLSRNSSIVKVTIPIAFDENVALIENILKKPNLTLSSELKEMIIGEPILRGVLSTDGDGKDIVFEINAKEENIDTVRYLFTLQVIDLLNKAGIQTPTPNIKVLK